MKSKLVLIIGVFFLVAGVSTSQAQTQSAEQIKDRILVAQESEKENKGYQEEEAQPQEQMQEEEEGQTQEQMQEEEEAQPQEQMQQNEEEQTQEPKKD